MTAQRTRSVTPTVRTAFRAFSAALTGLTAFATAAGTGWVAARAADDYEQTQAQKAEQIESAARKAAAERAAWLKAHPAVRIVTHRRPHRTVVQRVPTSAAVPGRGGTISRPSPSVRSSSGAVRPSTPAAPAAPAAPPPPPPPPPAPSSGS